MTTLTEPEHSSSTYADRPSPGASGGQRPLIARTEPSRAQGRPPADSPSLYLLRAAAQAMPSLSGQHSDPRARTILPGNDTLAPMPSSFTHAHPGPAASAARSTLLGRLKDWRLNHPIQVDALLALGFLVIGALWALLTATSTRVYRTTPPDALSIIPVPVATLLVVAAALALRRRAPLACGAVVLAASPLAIVFMKYVMGRGADTVEYGLYLMILPVLLSISISVGTVSSHSRISTSWAGWVVATMVPPLTFLLIGEADPLTPTEQAREWTPYAVIFLAAQLVGLSARSNRMRLEEAEARSVRLALAREQSALLAAAEERSRIAREMHDVVAHSLAVMITMADGASATIDRKPEQAKQALEMLSEAGRTALADTRRLVGVLREDPSVSTRHSEQSGHSSSGAASTAGTDPTEPAGPAGPRPEGDQAGATGGRWHRKARRRTGGDAPASAAGPQVRDLPMPEFAPPGTVAPIEPSAPIEDLRHQATSNSTDPTTGTLPTAPAPEQADIGALVARFTKAGVPVSYSWSGRDLPDDKALQLTLFRIAQEALTNVLRYAPTTCAVTVAVERHNGTVVLTVDNEAAPGSRPMHGSGKGLIGMRERAAVYGGSVQAGPTASGWQVRAVLRWDENDEGASSWQTPL